MRMVCKTIVRPNPPDGGATRLSRDRARKVGFSLLECTTPDAAPRVGRFAHDATEPTRQVRLIGETALERDFAQRVMGRQHQALCHLDPPTCEIAVRRYTERAFEGAMEMARAQVKDPCELVDGNASTQVGIDVFAQPALLPCHETPT